MDLTLIKGKLDSFQNKGTNKDRIDYTKIFWKPKAGKYQIRIVPSKFNKKTPFREIYFHYGYTKGPILALTNWGEVDPINEAAQKLRKSAEPEHWQMAKKITPKMRIFAPVIVRGEEEANVRLWEFGKELYTQLLNIAMNEDYGDYTDVQDGRDFIVEAVEADIAGRRGIKCTVTPRVKTTPLSSDASLVTSWLEEQPDILSINKKHTYESLSEIFQKWANPDEDTEEPIVFKQDNESVDIPWGIPITTNPSTPTTPTNNYTLHVPTQVKQSKADKFNDLFSEDNDDLPF